MNLNYTYNTVEKERILYIKKYSLGCKSINLASRYFLYNHNKFTLLSPFNNFLFILHSMNLYHIERYIYFKYIPM